MLGYIGQHLEKKLNDILAFLQDDVEGLDIILRDIGLSDEKFMRMVSLLRKIGRVSGGFNKEWTIKKIKKELEKNDSFSKIIASLLFNGIGDKELKNYIPRYYLEKLNYREIGNMPVEFKKFRYKEAQIGTYGGRKGYKVEERIKDELEIIQAKYGIDYE